jgi:hypothetical protein
MAKPPLDRLGGIRFSEQSAAPTGQGGHCVLFEVNPLDNAFCNAPRQPGRAAIASCSKSTLSTYKIGNVLGGVTAVRC